MSWAPLRIALGAAGILHAAAASSAEPGAPAPEPAAVSVRGTRYGPSYFESFRPRTALDMVLRLPGFTIDEGSAGRGLEGSDGNVLVDGARPGGKSGSVTVELQRIPASAVAAIVLLRGAQAGVDMAGFGAVANVLTKPSGGLGASGSLSLDSGGAGGLGTTATVEIRRKRRGSSASLGASAGRQGDSGGGETRLSAPGGDVVGLEALRSSHETRSRSANLSLSKSVGSDLRLSADGDLSRTMIAAEDVWRPVFEGASRSFASKTRQSRASGSLAGEYEASDALRLGGTLYRSEGRLRLSARSLFDGIASSFLSDQETAETAARFTADVTLPGGSSVNAGADYAFNRFESSAFLAGPEGPVPIPNGRILVSERRYGGFASYSWRRGALDGQLRLRIDRAALRGQGALDSRRSLVEIKPRVQLGYQADPATRLDLTLERDVGQLAFAQFAASAELDDGTVKAGSTAIDPVRSWIAQASLQHGFWRSGSLTLSARAEAIANPIDFVPSPEGLDSSGNLGLAYRASLEAKLALPLGPLGLRGARIDLDQTFLYSAVDDPVTGDRRTLSGLPAWRWTVSLRHDLPDLPLGWGLSASGQSPTRQFRLHEVSRLSVRPSLGLFAEWTLTPRLSLRASLGSGGGTSLSRRIYGGRRDEAPLAFVEESGRRREKHFGLTVSFSR